MDYEEEAQLKKVDERFHKLREQAETNCELIKATWFESVPFIGRSIMNGMALAGSGWAKERLQIAAAARFNAEMLRLTSR